MLLFDKIGIDGSYIVLFLVLAVLALTVLYVILLRRLKQYREKYNKFMEGSDGKNLESSILNKFSEIDKLKKSVKNNSEDIKQIFESLKYTYQKFSIVKYDAFKEMGGKLSFSLCMLTDNNDGFVFTSMHSNNEGCYTYIKEIIKGESFVLLGEEEKKALQQAKNRKSCLDD